MHKLQSIDPAHESLMLKVVRRCGSYSSFKDLELYVTHQGKGMIKSRDLTRRMNDREFCLLWLLVRSKCVVTYDEIFHFLYGEDEEPPLRNVIAIYVTRLRELLRVLDSEARIENFMRVGYEII